MSEETKNTTFTTPFRAARDIGVSERTLDRWIAKKLPGFPDVIVINGRRYLVRAEWDAWLKANRRPVSQTEAA